MKKKSVAKVMRWQCIDCLQAKVEQDEEAARVRQAARQAERQAEQQAAAAGAAEAAVLGTAAGAASAAPDPGAEFSFAEYFPVSFTFYVRGGACGERLPFVSLLLLPVRVSCVSHTCVIRVSCTQVDDVDDLRVRVAEPPRGDPDGWQLGNVA